MFCPLPLPEAGASHKALTSLASEGQGPGHSRDASPGQETGAQADSGSGLGPGQSRAEGSNEGSKLIGEVSSESPQA
jgi:hypothetical protein